jgi:hypothetical protein
MSEALKSVMEDPPPGFAAPGDWERTAGIEP